MNRRFLTALTLAIILTPYLLRAEQEVRLKSGAAIVGEVKLDGGDAVVTIEGKEMRVPLAEVASVTAVGGGEGEAKRLLLAALESQLLNGSGKEVIAVLAEAHRMAPDDARITFWYANALADGGYPTGAKEVLAEQRDAIAKVFPGMADRLEKQIDERLEFEKLPPRLFKRIDRLNAELARQSMENNQQIVAAAFRIVDQHGDTVDQSSLQLNGNLSDEQLEGYGDGYFLLTGKQHRSNSRQPCIVRITDPTVRSAEFRVTFASDRVPTDEKFEIHRFGASDKREYRVVVVGPDDAPIAGAKVSFHLESGRGQEVAPLPTVVADDEGVAKFKAFPLQYSALVEAEGYKAERFAIDVPNDELPAEAPTEKKIKLYRPIAATVRVEWQAKIARPDIPGTALGAQMGKATLRVGGPANPRGYDPSQPQWVRALQDADRLALQFNALHHGMYGNMPVDSWLRMVKVDAAEENLEARVDAALKQFKEIDLEKLDELKEELEEPELPAGPAPFGNGANLMPAKAGDVYVGKLMAHDPRGGPVNVAFKLVVEKAKKAGGGVE